MNVLDAMRKALSGLNAQSDALANISNNIANSSTVGYNSLDTQFDTLVSEGGSTGQSQEMGVSTNNRMNISTAGQISSTGIATDIAVNGGGFLVVNSSANASTGTYAVTRAGSFRPDANGNLVNVGGYYLQGSPLNADGTPANGNTSNGVSDLSTVNISNISASATPTTAVTFNANLPSAETAYSLTPSGPSSTAVTYYDPLGQAQQLTMSFTPAAAAAAGDPQTNTWTMNITDTASKTATNPTGLVGQAQVVFNANGANAGTMASVTPTAASPAAPGDGYDAITGDFTVPTGNGSPIKINIGKLNSTQGMTQLSGDYSAEKVTKDGSSFGLLQGVSVNNSGQVVASFTNGSTRPLYQLSLAMLPNENGLQASSGNTYLLSQAAGVPTLETPGTGSAGTTEGGSLEGSNVDIGSELTNLIQTQRAYQSNATVVTTSDQMLQTLNQMKA